jgi:hypothetical protein
MKLLGREIILLKWIEEVNGSGYGGKPIMYATFMNIAVLLVHAIKCN